MYSVFEPPYVLLAIGFLMSVASGAAFSAILKQLVQEWSKNRFLRFTQGQASRHLANLRGTQVLLPFYGITVGIWLFLAAGLGIFGFPQWFAFGISLLLTLLTAALVWYQLGQVLTQLESGGSQALDLDS